MFPSLLMTHTCFAVTAFLILWYRSYVLAIPQQVPWHYGQTISYGSF